MINYLFYKSYFSSFRMLWWSLQWLQKPLWFSVEQRASLVNVKLKWVKDRTLDSVVTHERNLQPVQDLIERIYEDPHGQVSAQELSKGRLLNATIFMRRFPSIFQETSTPRGPYFGLTENAHLLRQQELQVLHDTEPDLINRLCRLLMLTVGHALPLHTIDQLKWDMGLPSDYQKTLILQYPAFFELIQPPGDERIWLKLLHWDPDLAVSQLQKSCNDRGEACLAFPIRFTRGFGLKRKCMQWLKEWQSLPYTSPYKDASGLDPRTDVSEKRIVGVFHELLHLTIGKKTERRNLSNLRKPLALPQKFTKVFERHPGIFYLSEKLATQTVILREAYDGGRELLCKHPIIGVREKYVEMMREGILARKGALYRKQKSNKEAEDHAAETLTAETCKQMILV